MLFKKNNDAAQTEAASNKNTSAPDNHRDAVSPSERAMIAAASGDTHKSGAAPAKPASTKYDYLNAPIVKSRPCPLCGEHLEADTVFCPKCNNRVVSIYDEALILRRQGKTLPKKETKTESAAPAKTEVPKAEAKPAPKKGGLAAFTDPDTPDSLVIKVTGSGYTKHTMNPHFSPADDFDD